MRKLLKTLLPPFMGFAIYFLAIRYSSIYFSLKIDEMGEGTVKSFMAYYRYLMPLLFAVAVLTQLLIVVPVWDRVQSTGAKVSSWLVLIFICLAFACGIGYVIWDHTSGRGHLIRVCLFLTAVQLVYWVINISMLHILNEKETEDDEPATEKPGPEE